VQWQGTATSYVDRGPASTRTRRASEDQRMGISLIV
jgi:hypothetical protein